MPARPPRHALTDDIVTAAGSLAWWMRVVAAAQLVGILVLGAVAFALLFPTLFSAAARPAWVLATVGLVVWVARASALGSGAAMLDDIRRGVLVPHERLQRGIWAITRSMVLDGFAILLALGLLFAGVELDA
jgi:hypothetical protein